ncbi:unnamed protein product, partial [Polarella glacialis]
MASTIPAALGLGGLKRSQLEILKGLVTKHLADPALTEIASTDDFTVTSIERGVPRYEHSHLIAALDVVLTYQRNRRAKGFSLLGARASMRSTYRHDPRTRLIELLKRWLRTHAANANIGEDEVRRMCGLCRDLLNYPNLFPSRNQQSFMHVLSEVYEHLQLQLRQVLEKDRTCAELATRALSLSRNLISDAVTFLLLAPTDLTQTDKLPSTEVVLLWQTLPAGANPLPRRADPKLQKAMQDGWQTMVGSLLAAILGLRWTFRLFDGAGAEEEATAAAAEAKALVDAAPTTLVLPANPAEGVPALIARVREEFRRGHFKTSGLAGAFREPTMEAARNNYLAAVEAVFDLLYLLGEVLFQFHRISDGLGDYGMIRVAPWFHPCLEAITEKVQRLRSSLDALNSIVDSELVIAKARGRAVKKPCPTERMSAQGHAAMERAVCSKDSHTQLLLTTLEELRARSAPERLPHVVEGLGDACAQLQNVLSSPEFQARVGDAFPKLPPLSRMGLASPLIPLVISLENASSVAELDETAVSSESDGGEPGRQTAGSSSRSGPEKSSSRPPVPTRPRPPARRATIDGGDLRSHSPPKAEGGLAPPPAARARTISPQSPTASSVSQKSCLPGLPFGWDFGAGAQARSASLPRSILRAGSSFVRAISCSRPLVP